MALSEHQRNGNPEGASPIAESFGPAAHRVAAAESVSSLLSRGGGNVVQFFEEAAALRADSVALVAAEQELTYRELNQRANRLAHYLVSRGVRAESLVGGCLGRSVEMVVALLAA